MVKEKNKTVNMSFEEALNELEIIVKTLESGNLNLDEALLNFEKGISLSRICSQKLEQAEKKIELLTVTDEGTTVLKPAQLTEASDE